MSEPSAPLTRTIPRLALVGTLALTVILLIVITAIIVTGTGHTRARGLTVTPAFDDPRLSLTVAYPFRGVDGFTNPTALPYDALPKTLEREYTTTRGVQECKLYLSSIVTIIGSCTVDEGLNTVAMAELLRLLADRQYYDITVDLRLSDGDTSTRYVWDNWVDGWQITPLTHPSYDDPRLALDIAYNPPPDRQRTVPPATSDARPYEERILTAFLNTPGVRDCTIALEDNPYPPPVFGNVGQADQVIVNAECAVDPTHNTVEKAEWLRRLANRALLDTNTIACEDMWMCNNILALPVTNLVLDDGSARLRYEWNARTWVIEAAES